MEREFFSATSLTLDGAVEENFYVDPIGLGATIDEIANGDKTLTLTFAWAEGVDAKTDLSDATVEINKDNFTSFLNGNSQFKIPVTVAAAEMTCDIVVTGTVGEESDTMSYSVRDYADTILDANSAFSAAFIAENGQAKYDELVDLVEKMLDYGAKAQAVFGVKTDDMANDGVAVDTDEITAADVLAVIDGTASILNGDEVAAYGLEFKYTTVVYLADTSLRLYYKVVDADLYNAAKGTLGANERKLAATGMVYFEVANIAAEKLHELQTFAVGKCSVLNYVAAVLAAPNASAAEKDLAAAMYRYNRAAVEFAD